MKRLFTAISLVVAALVLRADDSADLEERARRLKALVADLDSERPDVRDEAATRLLAAGSEAIPYVVDGVYRKNAKLHLQVLEKLIAQEKKGLPTELQMSEADLKEIVKGRVGDPKLPATARQYLYTRYLDAVELYRKGRFEDALARIAAIRELEPKPEFDGDLKKLRILCEERIVQTSLVQLSATTMTPIVADNTIAKVTFTATNMSDGPVEIWFGAPEDASNPDVKEAVLETNAVLQVEVVTTTCDPDGGVVSEVDPSIKKLNRYSIALKKGETVRLYEMEVPAMTGGIKLVRLTVSAKMRVAQIDGQGAPRAQRSLSFQPAEIRVVPGKIQEAAANALQSLLAAIDAGQPDSVFLFCNVMPDKDRPLAVEALMRILRDAKYTDYDRSVARNCLQTLTGEFFRDSDGWLKWDDEAKKAAGGNR